MQSSPGEGLQQMLYERPDYMKLSCTTLMLSQHVLKHLEKDIIISVKAHEASCTNYISQETHLRLREKNKCMLVEIVLQDC